LPPRPETAAGSGPTRARDEDADQSIRSILRELETIDDHEFLATYPSAEQLHKMAFNRLMEAIPDKDVLWLNLGKREAIETTEGNWKVFCRALFKWSERTYERKQLSVELRATGATVSADLRALGAEYGELADLATGSIPGTNEELESVQAKLDRLRTSLRSNVELQAPSMTWKTGQCRNGHTGTYREVFRPIGGGGFERELIPNTVPLCNYRADLSVKVVNKNPVPVNVTVEWDFARTTLIGAHERHKFVVHVERSRDVREHADTADSLAFYKSPLQKAPTILSVASPASDWVESALAKRRKMLHAAAERVRQGGQYCPKLYNTRQESAIARGLNKVHRGAGPGAIEFAVQQEIRRLHPEDRSRLPQYYMGPDGIKFRFPLREEGIQVKIVGVTEGRAAVNPSDWETTPRVDVSGDPVVPVAPERERVRRATRDYIHLTIMKYHDMDPETFFGRFSSKEELHSAVVEELASYARTLPPKSTLGAVSGEFASVEVNNDPAVLWKNSGWAERVFKEKEAASPAAAEAARKRRRGP
jgi:hypothetical protein